ncbi:MAG: hypothetical protein ACRCVA_17805, partial [Phreatobacter sp.]
MREAQDRRHESTLEPSSRRGSNFRQSETKLATPLPTREGQDGFTSQELAMAVFTSLDEAL